MISKSAKQLFSERFNYALTEAGMEQFTQQQLGIFFDVSGQAVRKWRNAESMPNSTRAPQVAQLLKIRRAWLIDGESPMRDVEVRTSLEESSPPYSAHFSLTEEELNVLGHYRKLPIATQDSIAHLLSTLVKK